MSVDVRQISSPNSPAAGNSAGGSEQRPSFARNAFDRFRSIIPSGSRVSQAVLVFLALLLILLVVYPLMMLVYASFASGLSARGMGEEITFSNYTAAFTNPGLRAAIYNTMYITIFAVIISIVVGVPMAWFLARTNIPGRGLMWVMIGLAYMTPGYQGAIAYIVLAGPNAGLMNRWFVALTGAERGPLNVYSLWGIIFVISINLFPYVVFLVSAALQSVDSSLEQAAQILGASRFRILIDITWKLVLPAILSAGLLVFVSSMSLFGSHAFLGIPAGIYTLPTRIYILFGFPPDYAQAASLSMILILLTVLVLWIQRSILARRSYITVSGKAASQARLALSGPVRWTAAAVSHLWFALAVYIPVSVLVGVSFSRSRARGFTAGNWTMRNYETVLFGSGLTRRGITNSLTLGVTAATIGTILGALIAYMTVRTKTRTARFTDFLAMIPLGLPGIVLAVSFVLGWIRVPLPVYGTAYILLIAYVTRTIPLSVRAADGAIRQIDPSLENAARMGGATWARSLFDVTLPLMIAGLLAAWSLIFVQSVQELAATILLFSPGNETIAIAIYQRVEDGLMEHAAALSVVVMIIASLVLWIARKVSGQNLATKQLKI